MECLLNKNHINLMLNLTRGGGLGGSCTETQNLDRLLKPCSMWVSFFLDLQVLISVRTVV